MTTFAAQQESDRLRAELEARTCTAWAEYRDTLCDLDDRDYEEAEPAAWEQLQATLRELDDQRAELARKDGTG